MVSGLFGAAPSVRVMTTARNTAAAIALAVLALPLVAFAFSGPTAQPLAGAKPSGDGCRGAYGWPIKPFDEAHPVRANFGDPRTRFDGGESSAALLEGSGTFSFHQGVDISAPDGSPVYAVASGTVTRARGARVTVDCGNGRSIQYWHIEPTVRAGQRAVAGKTVLGFIQPKREHVHLTHLERSRPVNPLAPGHLAPYEDDTAPELLEVGVEYSGTLVQVVADVVDTPALSVPGRWNGFPVTPARLTWRIEREGAIVVSTHAARDVRRFVPRNADFWSTYARGTHQNWPVFAGRKLQYRTGRYLFSLSGAGFDTSRIASGEYEIVVTAEDTAGNQGVHRLALTVP